MSFLSQVAEGTIVKLAENGVPVNFYVAKQNYEPTLNGNGRVLMVRETPYISDQWNLKTVGEYGQGEWLSTNYKALFDPNIQNLMGETKFYYSPYTNYEIEVFSSAVFSLSLYELGISHDWCAEQGTPLPIADTLKIAYVSGSPVVQWTRTKSAEAGGLAYAVDGDGDYDYAFESSGYWIRPVFTLPGTLFVSDDGTVSDDPPAPETISVPGSALYGQTVSISWSAVAGATGYKLERKLNDEAWTQIYTGGATAFTDTPSAPGSVQYRLSSTAGYGYGDTKTSALVPVAVPAPSTVTAPSVAMVNQSIGVSWGAVAVATGYKLERKLDDGAWTTLYTGPNISYQDTAPSAAGSVSYRVSASVGASYSAVTNSAQVTVLAASVLVISGEDGAIGSITTPVVYTVLTDTGEQISITESVNGVTRSMTAQSGQEISIPVEKLAPGAGSIVIRASVQQSSGTVSATRTWTYNKVPVNAPTGPYKIEQFQDENGTTVIPQGLAEAVFMASGENMEAAFANGLRPRKNLLNNWYFVGGGSQQLGWRFPINQRGAVSGDLSADSYIIDRWRVQAQLQNVSYSIDADGVSITTSAGNQGLNQLMEGNRLIPGETYTSTVLLADGTLMTKTFTLSEQGNVGMYYDGSQWSCAIVPAGTLWAYFPVIQYVGGLTIKIAAIKLEKGPTQTLAYQDEDGNWKLFETPDYLEEFFKCQYYYVKDTVQVITNASGVAVIQLPRKMRLNPTCTVDVGTFSSASLSTIYITDIGPDTGAVVNYTASAEL